MKVIDVLSGAPTNSSHGNGDRFKLSIPYAGQKIVWHVVFNHQRPQFAPNFCFDDESFLADPEIPFLEENVPSLASWNSRDPKALLNVIAELLALYRKHQVINLTLILLHKCECSIFCVNVSHKYLQLSV